MKFVKTFGRIKKLIKSKFKSFTLFFIYKLSFIDKTRIEIKELIDCYDIDKLVLIIQLWPKYEHKISAIILNHCIDNQSYDVLSYLLSQNMIHINCCLDQYGWTAIHKAVYNKDIQLMLLMMEYGIKIDVFDSNGNTPFHVLMQSTQKSKGVKIETDQDYGCDCQLKLLELMLNYCQEKNLNLLNIRNYFGKTVLHYAVVNPSTEKETLMQLISILLENGANPDAEDGRYRTPIFCAINERHSEDRQQEIVKKLIDANCDSLNLYEYKHYKISFTLKQLCRKYFVQNYPQLNFNSLINSLPRDLIKYLNLKLI